MICIITSLLILALYIIGTNGLVSLKKLMDLSIYWNGSITHKISKWLIGGQIPKVARASMAGVFIVMSCSLSLIIQPIHAEVNSSTKQIEETSSSGDDSGMMVSGSQQLVKPVEPEEKKEEEAKPEAVKEIKETKETKETKEAEVREEDKPEEEEVKESAWEEIPLCETKSQTKTYMDDVKITNRNSEQWALFNTEKYGEVITDNIGFQYIEGEDPDTGEPMKFYTVALGTYYMDHVGQKFRITLDSGFTFGAIIGDIKSDAHTHAGNNSANVKREGHNSNKCLAGSNDMIEFVIDAEVMGIAYPGKNGLANNGSMNYNFDKEHMFQGATTKIEVLKDEQAN